MHTVRTRAWGRAARGGAALALALTSLAACAEPAPRATPVGRLTRLYVDSSRTDWDGRGPRPVAATIWYPAAAGTAETSWRIGVFRFGRGARDAAFANRTHRPVVLLSHGTGGSVAQHSWLAEALVQHGFVVVGVNHHGNTAAESSYRAPGFVLPWERAYDLSVVLDRLAADSLVGPHVDTGRVGAAGFSLGGYTVLALGGARLEFARLQQDCDTSPSVPSCTLPPEANFTRADLDSLARSDAPYQAAVGRNNLRTHDVRIRAIYAMAPALVPFLDTLSLKNVAVPARVVLGVSDTQVPPEPTATLLSRHVPRAELDVRTGVVHYAFLAPCGWRGRVVMRTLCSDGSIARATLHASLARDAVAFFSVTLAPARSDP